MIVLAPAAIKIAFGENPISVYGTNGNIPSTRMGIASLIREEFFLAKQYFDAEQSGTFSPDFTKECYRELFEGKIPLKAHVHRTDDILTAVRIAKEFGLGLTLDHCTEGHLISEKIAQSGFPAIVAYYKNLGETYYNELVDMVVFDAIVCNTDRHYGNFGFMVDNDANKIAPMLFTIFIHQ